jgi:hypothetical protein
MRCHTRLGRDRIKTSNATSRFGARKKMISLAAGILEQEKDVFFSRWALQSKKIRLFRASFAKKTPKKRRLSPKKGVSPHPNNVRLPGPGSHNEQDNATTPCPRSTQLKQRIEIEHTRLSEC